MISEIEDYFARGCGRCDRFDTLKCSTKRWAKGLATLRDICVSSGLKETVKWGHPCYMHADRKIAIIGAFLGDFRLSFFDAALMKDPEKILEMQGPNTRYPDMIRFTSNCEPDDLRAAIVSYLYEAKGYAESGQRPPKDEIEWELPEELLVALEVDPVLSAAFYALTRGRRNSYVIAIKSAKKSETRVARIEKFREKIIAGKGAMER